jgi:hypothetical protein
MRIWIKNTAFFVQIIGFAIGGLGHQVNLRIWDLRINQYKLSDLRFADWHTSEICDFAICGLRIKNCVYTFARHLDKSTGLKA